MTAILATALSVSYVVLAWYVYARVPFQQHYPGRLCAENVEVIVAFQSSPDNHTIRDFIRKSVTQTSARAALPWRILFYMGYTSELPIQERLRKESVHNDLVVIPLPHHPRSVIPIFLETIRWIKDECGRSLRYFVHVHETTFVDVLALYEYIRKLTDGDQRFHCWGRRSEPVQRNLSFADAVPETVFRGTFFPNYCLGGVFVLGASFLQPLLLAADAVPQYPLLAQYITGHLSVLLRLGHDDLSDRMMYAEDDQNEGERKLFVLGLSQYSSWKKLWLRSSVCYAGTNLTADLMRSVLNTMEITYLH